MPERYQDADWDKVDVDDARNVARNLSEYVESGRGLMVAGPVGTGKSSLAALLSKTAIQFGFTVRWEYVPKMLDEAQARDTGSFVKHRQRIVDLLVWDDFGVQALAPWEISLLDRIVESRYSRKRSMIVTSNIDPSVYKDDPALSRFVDRWRETLRILHVGGESKREPF